MPRSTRQWAQRKLDEARNNLDWSATHLKAVYDVYTKDHPEIGAVLFTAIDALAVVSGEISRLKTEF